MSLSDPNRKTIDTEELPTMERSPFTPSGSKVRRTPPTRNQIINAESRMETSSTGEEDRIERKRRDKRQRTESPNESTWTNIDKIENSQQIVEGYLEQTKIATSRELNSKISFTKADKMKVLECSAGIIEEFTKFSKIVHQQEAQLKLYENKVKMLEDMLQTHKDYQKIISKDITEIKKDVTSQLGKTYKDISYIKDMLESKRQMGYDAESDEETSAGEKRRENRDKIGKPKYRVGKNEYKEMENGKTYAQMLSKGGKTGEVVREGWQSPPMKTQWETVIRRKRGQGTDSEGEEPGKALKDIKDKLKKGGIGGPVKAIWETKEGGVIIKGDNKDQKQRIENIFRDTEKYVIKQQADIKPMLMITGINKGWEDKEILEEIARENEHNMEGVVGREIMEDIKIIARRQCRNEARENIIIETNPKIFRALINNENLTFDLLRMHVEEYVSVAICYRCCLYGHVAKHCVSKSVVCYKCGGAHEANKCEKREYNCINCEKMGMRPRQHCARDMKCPIFDRRLAQAKQLINYGK